VLQMCCSVLPRVAVCTYHTPTTSQHLFPSPPSSSPPSPSPPPPSAPGFPASVAAVDAAAQNVCVCVYMRMREYTRIYVYTYIIFSVYTCMFIYICVYIYIYMYIYRYM